MRVLTPVVEITTLAMLHIRHHPNGYSTLLTPLADSLIGHNDAPDKEQLFDIPVAEAEPDSTARADVFIRRVCHTLQTATS
jgi:hypothetical protein